MSCPDSGKLMARRSRWRQRWGAVAFVGGVLAIVTVVSVVTEKFPRLSAEEKTLVGRWYVRGEFSKHESCFIAIEEYRSDRTMTFSGRAFRQRVEEGRTSWEVEAELNPVQMPSRWRIVGRECHWERDRDDSFGFLDRVRLFLRTRRWLRGSSVFDSPAIVRLAGDEKEFEISSIGLTMPGVRVSEDFELPDEPLAADVALARWTNKETGEVTNEGLRGDGR